MKGYSFSELVKLAEAALPRIGTAVAALKLATARKIGGVFFDGTADINLPGVNVAGTQATSGNAGTATKLQTVRKIGGVDFDGTADINLPGVNVAGTQATSGNAGTATKLQTVRKIGGVLFDGTADINLPGVNVAGTQNTSGSSASCTGNAATATKLQTARTIAGQTFDGTQDVTISPTTIGAAAASHTHPWAQVTGVPVQATRWPTAVEAGALPVTSPIANGAMTADRYLTAGGGTVYNQQGTATTWMTNKAINDLTHKGIGVSDTEPVYFDGAARRPIWHDGNAPATATRWPTLAEIGAQPAGSYAAASHTHPVSQIAGLGTAATRNVGTATGNVMDSQDVRIFGGENSGISNPDHITSNAITYSTGTIATGLYHDGAIYAQYHSVGVWGHQIYGNYRTGELAVRGLNNTTWTPWRRVWDDGNAPVTATRWPTPAEIGLGNVENWQSSTGVDPNTNALRDGNGDLVARQFYGSHAGDGYALTNLQWARLTGVPVTALRWPNWEEISGKPARTNPWVHLDWGATPQGSVDVPVTMQSHLNAGGEAELRLFLRDGGDQIHTSYHKIIGDSFWRTGKWQHDCTWAGKAWCYLKNNSASWGNEKNKITCQHNYITRVEFRLL